jgi:hypothetical protein
MSFPLVQGQNAENEANSKAESAARVSLLMFSSMVHGGKSGIG